MSYPIEIRLASKNGFHTPAEAKEYYGRYSRDGITVHWWDDPTQVRDSDHDNIVNYILSKSERGAGSVNYVISNRKITMLVNPDNVAWASQGGNPTTVSIECSPHLSREGYKKLGWVINELFNPKTGRYKRAPGMWEHSDWWQTICAGSVSKIRAGKEAKKWSDGVYNPVPPPAPKPKPVPKKKPNLTWHLWKEGEVEYELNKNTHLYDVDAKTWSGIKKVKRYNKGHKVTIVGHVHNRALDRDYYITWYTFNKKAPTGFHPEDLDVHVAPRPTPKPPKEPKPGTPAPEPTKPDDPDTEYPNWFVQFVKDLIRFLSNKIGVK